MTNFCVLGSRGRKMAEKAQFSSAATEVWHPGMKAWPAGGEAARESHRALSWVGLTEMDMAAWALESDTEAKLCLCFCGALGKCLNLSGSGFHHL